MSASFGRSGFKPSKPSRWWRSFGMVAVLAAVVGTVSVAVAPVVYVLGMITIIGIPFALIAVIFPTLCLWVVIAYAVYRIKPLDTRFGVIRSFGVALLLMAIIPQAYNFRLDRAVAQLQHGDIPSALPKLNKTETFGLIAGSGRSRKCFNTCIDLLLSRQIGAFVSAGLPRGAVEPDAQSKATVFRLVRSPVCEDDKVRPKNKSSNENKPGTVAYQLKQANQRGICIRSEETLLGAVGNMRAVVKVDRKNLDYPESLFFIDTKMSAAQIAVYEFSRDQNAQKTHQQTTISYSRLKPFLAHAISGGTISSMRSGLWRDRIFVRSINTEKFLTDKLGAKLLPQ